MAITESHYEESLKRDIEQIKKTIREMAEMNEGALRNSMRALKTRDRQLAYTVILRDRIIDALETELDRRCLEFIIRQQPVAGHLRFVYATIKIIREMERIGDYAESIARQVLRLIPLKPVPSTVLFDELADVSIKMFHDAVQAFLDCDEARAKSLMAIEDQADGLRSQINQFCIKQQEAGKLALEALNPMLTIARRLERLADQAKNICEEVIYMATGQVAKHKHSDKFNILFVDSDHSCLSRMAEAIGRSLVPEKFEFFSAGIHPSAVVDTMAAEFLGQKQIFLQDQPPRTIAEIYAARPIHVIVALGVDVRRSLPADVINPIIFDWPMADPCKVTGVAGEIHAGYQLAFESLSHQLLDLVQAVMGHNDKDPSIGY